MKTTVLKMSYSQSKNYSPQVQVKTTVLTMNTSPPSQDQLNFVRTSNFFQFLFRNTVKPVLRGHSWDKNVTL